MNFQMSHCSLNFTGPTQKIACWILNNNFVKTTSEFGKTKYEGIIYGFSLVMMVDNYEFWV